MYTFVSYLPLNIFYKIISNQGLFPKGGKIRFRSKAGHFGIWFLIAFGLFNVQRQIFHEYNYLKTQK